MTHPDIANPCYVTQDAFDQVWEAKGWVLDPEPPTIFGSPFGVICGMEITEDMTLMDWSVSSELPSGIVVAGTSEGVPDDSAPADPHTRLVLDPTKLSLVELRVGNTVIGDDGTVTVDTWGEATVFLGTNPAISIIFFGTFLIPVKTVSALVPGADLSLTLGYRKATGSESPDGQAIMAVFK